MKEIESYRETVKDRVRGRDRDRQRVRVRDGVIAGDR